MEKLKEYKIGYARVSKTDDTQNDSLMEQVKLLKEKGCEKIYFEKASGGKDDRVEFHKAIKKAKMLSKNYQVSLVCYRLDRLARSPRLILNVLEDLEEKNINIISLSEGLDSNYATGKMMIQMLSIMSNWELNSIKDRVRVGVENARKRGVRLGRPPKLNKSKVNQVIRLYQLNSLTVKEIAARCSISESSCYSILKQAKISRRR